MDPNETLNRLRHAIENYADAVNRLAAMEVAHGTAPKSLYNTAMMYADEVAEYAEALDNWVTGGGFLPAQWRQHPRREAPNGQ